MNVKRLYEILNATTFSLRKGEKITERNKGTVHVTTINLNPHESTARADLEKIDVVFLIIGVDKKMAEAHREELIGLLDQYPDREQPLNRGPSYMHVGAVIGDQGAAFQLFALGQVLGIWKIITPAVFGFGGDEALDLAGRGFIMIDGYHPRPEQTAS